MQVIECVAADFSAHLISNYLTQTHNRIIYYSVYKSNLRYAIIFIHISKYECICIFKRTALIFTLSFVYYVRVAQDITHAFELWPFLPAIGFAHLALLIESSLTHFIVEIVMLEKLDCVLSKRATRPYIYGHTNANAYVLIYV
jgi:hypothetical protein